MCTKLRNPRSSIDWYPQLIHDQLSIDTSVDNQPTLHQHLSQMSVESQLIFDQFIRVGQHSANYWLSVNQVSIECQQSIDRDVDWVLIKSVNRHLTGVALNMFHSASTNQELFQIKLFDLWPGEVSTNFGQLWRLTCIFKIPVSLFKYLTLLAVYT